MTPTELCCSKPPAKDSSFRAPTLHPPASAAPAPRTSFMIDDILQQTPSRSSRTISSSSGVTEEGSCCSTYGEDAARRSDSPVSIFSEDTERGREGSPDGSDSDAERSNSQGRIFFCVSFFFSEFHHCLCYLVLELWLIFKLLMTCVLFNLQVVVHHHQKPRRDDPELFSHMLKCLSWKGGSPFRNTSQLMKESN